jgi:hypothetical protein
MERSPPYGSSSKLACCLSRVWAGRSSTARVQRGPSEAARHASNAIQWSLQARSFSLLKQRAWQPHLGIHRASASSSGRGTLGCCPIIETGGLGRLASNCAHATSTAHGEDLSVSLVCASREHKRLTGQPFPRNMRGHPHIPRRSSLPRIPRIVLQTSQPLNFTDFCSVSPSTPSRHSGCSST